MKPVPAPPPLSPSGPACPECGRPGAVEYMGALLCAECYQQGASSCAGGRESSESSGGPECGSGD